MKINQKIALVLFTLTSLFFLTLSSTQAVSIINTSSPNVLVDEFDEPFLGTPDQTKPWDYWYKMLIGVDNLGYRRAENLTSAIDCNEEVCVTKETENGLGFARLQIGPANYTDAENVRIAQISDQRDSFSYVDPHRWSPSVGHPVEFSVRFRASDTYKADASGSAVGNFSFTLFNYSDYYLDQNQDVERNPSGFTRQPDQTYLLGFTWTDSQTVGGALTGLSAAAADKYDLLPFVFPIRNVNINNWTDLKIRWEVNALGIQTVKYYVNNQLLTLYVPPFPMPPLGMFIYNNNERFQLTPEGLRPTHVDVPATQYIDIDRVEARQL